MDDLDRFYFELVDVLRRESPAGLREPITVRDVHERLVPYRRVRDAVGFRSNGEYETTLSRLLAGERRYLLAEAREMADAIREGLGQPIPDVRRYLAHPDATIRLNPAEIPPPGDRRYAPPGQRTADAAPSEGSSDPDLTPEPEPETGIGGFEPAGFEPATDSRPEPEPLEAADGAGPVEPVADEDPGGAGAPEGIEGSEPPRCTDCGAALDGSFRYCPGCGARLRAGSCRACGTELEPDWRFCPQCGQDRDAAGERPDASA